ncbi:hypothetical protein E3N88_31160 [Mikania micrantha]|uniref:RRM domain-containing protein n=1 Tax=Mikania micrantha TaxID=192012 RepID=A0A5N6MPI3_9ASTR|nr:hypothetical protein E3N88_31160 [Mikania micrantha]
MPKSAKKKPASKVPLAPVFSKRDAEEIIENEIVSSKKQKIVTGGVVDAVEKKVNKKTQQKKINKQENISPESLVEEKEEPAAAVSENGAVAAKSDEPESNASDSLNEEDDKPASEIIVAVKPAAKVEEEGSDDEEVSEDDSEENGDRSEKDDEPKTSYKNEDAMPTSEANIAIKSAAKVEEEGSDDEEGSEDDSEDKDDSSKENDESKTTMKNEDVKPASEENIAVKPVVKVEEEGSDGEEGSDNSEEEDDEPKTAEKNEDANPASETNTVVKLAAKVEEEGSDDEEGSEDYEEDDSFEEDDEPKTAKKNDVDVEMVEASSSKQEAQTPATPQVIGNKTLFMGNLSFSVEESDILNFFKDAGEVVEVRLAVRNGRLTGYGHVEFATPDAAQQALKHNGELLLNRAVRLDLAKEKSAHTPRNGNERSSQKTRQSQSQDLAQTPATPQATGTKTLFMGNLSFSVEESDILNFFKDAGEVVEVRLAVRDDQFAGFGHVEFATPDAAQQALKHNGELLLNRAVRLDLAKETSAYTPRNGNERSSQKSRQSQSQDLAQTPATPQDTGTKTLFVGNLSFSVEESDILNFFKDAGQVVEVRLGLRDDQFAGFGHVEFATPDAAQQALKLNGELLLNRAVRLDLAKEMGAHSPSTGNERSSQKSGQSHSLTVYVRGFRIDDGFDNIRSMLNEHFGQCGEITRLSIPKHLESDDPKGVAFIDFSNGEAFNRALELDGSEVSECTLTVEAARHVSGGRSGGRGKFGGGRGRFSGGRGRLGSRKGRLGVRDGGIGRGRGGRGKRF